MKKSIKNLETKAIKSTKSVKGGNTTNPTYYQFGEEDQRISIADL